MSQYVRNIALTVSRQVMGLVIGLLALALIARQLGAEIQGMYTLLILVPLTLFNFLNLGFVAASIYWIGQQKFELKDVYRTNQIVAIGLSALGLVIGIAFYFLFRERFFSEIPFSTYLITIACLPFLFSNYFLNSVFQGREDFKSYNSLLLINQGILVIGLLVTIVVFKLGLAGAAISFSVSHLITASLMGRYFRAGDYPISGGRLSPEYVKDGFKYGFKLYASNVLAFANYRADLFLIAYFLDFKSVGIYGMAVAVIERLWIVPGAVSNVLYSRVSNLDDKSERDRLTLVSTRNMLPFMLLAAGVLMLTADFVIPFVFKEEYRASVKPLYYLLPGVVLAAIAKTVSNDFSGRGRAEINTYVAIFTVLINVSLNLVLIPKYGIVGAAIATTVSYSFNALTKAFLFCRLFQQPMSDLLIIKKRDLELYKLGSRKRNSQASREG